MARRFRKAIDLEECDMYGATFFASGSNIYQLIKSIRPKRLSALIPDQTVSGMER
jgi:hypothetical protein